MTKYFWLIICSMALFMTACFTYKDVNFVGVQDYKISEPSLEKSKIGFNVKIDNPNNYNIKIKNSDLKFYVNGREIGNANLINTVIIKKNSLDSYPFEIEVNAKELLKAAMGSLGSLLGGNIKVGVKGKVKAKVYGVGKKFDVNFEETVNLKNFKL